jgi:gliding motility-associated-like protein
MYVLSLSPFYIPAKKVNLPSKTMCRTNYACKFITLTLLICTCFCSYSQTVDFTYSSTSGGMCSPATIRFAAVAPGAPTSYVWSFGNGQVASGASPTTTFTTDGTFTVKLTVVYATATDDVVKTITINPTAVVNATSDRNYICRPGNVAFAVTGNIGAGGTYVWNYGDNTTGTTANTSITHAYAAFGDYTANLTATNAAGCKAITSVPIRVQPPDINANIDRRDGCIPVSAGFSASVNVPATGSVTGYEWNFGDGTPAVTTTSPNTSHNYPTDGSYNPTLRVTTNEGCTNTYNFGNIAYGFPPTTPVAYLQKDTICASDTLGFVGKAGSANRYRWEFGDGNGRDVTDTLTRYRYRTLGSKTVTMTPYYNGCAGTTQSKILFVKGVVADYIFANDCNSKQAFNFTSTSLGNVTGHVWNMDDGTLINDVNTYRHVFSQPNDYATILIVSDNVAGCSDTAYKKVFYAQPTLTSSDTLVCKGDSVTFTINNDYNNPSATYTWDIAGDHFGPIPINVITKYKTKNLGVYYNFVEIDNGPGYCKDTIRQVKPIRVRGPQMDFTLPNAICLNQTVQFTNQSTPFYSQDSVRLWYWNYGNRSTNDTTFQPGTYQYTGSGTYQVTVWGRDVNGCKDSLSKPLVVNPIPFIQSFPIVDTLCLGSQHMLYAFHSDTLRWEPVGQVSCATCDTTFISPTTTSSFVARAVNQYGCVNTDTSLVKVYNPFSATVSVGDTAICLNENVQVTAGPANKMYKWLPATGISSDVAQSPRVGPKVTTQYRVAVSDSVGCFSDTAIVNIKVTLPPTVDAGPTRIIPYGSTFTFQPVYSSNVVSYNWSPSNYLSCTSCAIPTARNEYSQVFTVRVTSDSGCVARDTVKIIVECKDAYLLMPTAFSPDNNGLNDYYFPLTRGVSLIQNFAVYNRTGQLMYKLKNFVPNDRRFGWDGKYNGLPQPTGTYIYMMEALCESGQMLSKKGSFILMR